VSIAIVAVSDTRRPGASSADNRRLALFLLLPNHVLCTYLRWQHRHAEMGKGYVDALVSYSGTDTQALAQF
jgi:hypothetical protein